jgi:hypothetical protein
MAKSTTYQYAQLPQTRLLGPSHSVTWWQNVHAIYPNAGEQLGHHSEDRVEIDSLLVNPFKQHAD